MHPLVRDLYKRAITVGKDYPHPRGLDYVREVWKKALRDTKNDTFSTIEDPIRKDIMLHKPNHTTDLNYLKPKIFCNVGLL